METEIQKIGSVSGRYVAVSIVYKKYIGTAFSIFPVILYSSFQSKTLKFVGILRVKKKIFESVYLLTTFIYGETANAAG